MSGKRSKEMRRVACEIADKKKLTSAETRRLYQRIKGVVKQKGAAQLSE